MVKRKKTQKKALDDHLSKRGPGRPWSMAFYREVVNRSVNYRGVFSRPGVWEQLYPALKKETTTVADVEQAFIDAGVSELHDFIPSLASLILRVVGEPKFPRRTKSQIHFFADCLAARGHVKPRRSKDICDTYRKLFISDHSIIRYEYWVQCSCGYRGISTHRACRKCGAPVLRIDD